MSEVTLLSKLTASPLATSVLRFALVSGVGLALDFGVFLALTESGVRPGIANLISATLAVTFVYFVSAKRVFAYEGRFLLPLFLLYLGYQAIAVSAASWAVDAIALTGVLPLIAKLLILPVTFTANYLFMAYITRKRAV